MDSEVPAYGLWSLVILNSAVFIFFAFSFFKPSTTRDWRSFGAFSAFIVALFAEMYGFPLTIFLVSGWLQSRYPGIDWFSHDAGHLLEELFGWRSNPHFGPFHIASFVFIGGDSFSSRPPGRCCMKLSALGYLPRAGHMLGFVIRSTPASCSSCSAFSCNGPHC